MYFMVCNGLGIVYAVSQLSQFSANPLERHRHALKRVLRYLNGTADYGLLIDVNGEEDMNVS